MRSGQYAFRDRRARKGEFRRLWIQRINAACRLNDMSYSRFIAGLNAAGIEVDRKILADLAVTDPAAFGSLVETAKSGLTPGRVHAGCWAPATNGSNDCGASWGAAVRVGTRACSSSRARSCWPRRSTPAGTRSRRSSCRGPAAARRGARRCALRGSPPASSSGSRRPSRPSRCSPSSATALRAPRLAGADVRDRVRRRRRSGQPRARSCDRPRPPAPMPSCSRRVPSTSTTRRSSGPRPGRCSTCRSSPTSSWSCGRPVFGARDVLGHGLSPHRHRPHRPDRPGGRQRGARAGGRRRRSTDGSPSRTPDGPRASTWRWPPPSSASRSPASDGCRPPIAGERIFWLVSPPAGTTTR